MKVGGIEDTVWRWRVRAVLNGCVVQRNRDNGWNIVLTNELLPPFYCGFSNIFNDVSWCNFNNIIEFRNIYLYRYLYLWKKKQNIVTINYATDNSSSLKTRYRFLIPYTNDRVKTRVQKILIVSFRLKSYQSNLAMS